LSISQSALSENVTWLRVRCKIVANSQTVVDFSFCLWYFVFVNSLLLEVL
jgi:hypothetical protein